MKCVILAAGEGMRMRPLTEKTPKPMILVAGKPLLEHIISALPEKIDELIIVVGYLGEQIKEYFGDKFGRFKVRYVVQEKKVGTYDALRLCEPFLDDEKFLLLFADDLHGSKGLRECADSENLCVLVAMVEDPRKFGVVELTKEGLIEDIEEKPENPRSNLVSTGVLLLDKSVFRYPAQQHSSGEYFLTDSLAQMIKDGCKFSIVKSSFWLPIGYPKDIVGAEKLLAKQDLP